MRSTLRSSNGGVHVCSTVPRMAPSLSSGSSKPGVLPPQCKRGAASRAAAARRFSSALDGSVQRRRGRGGRGSAGRDARRRAGRPLERRRERRPVGIKVGAVPGRYIRRSRPVPLLEHDPWRTQYFPAVQGPPDVVVPTDDPHAYRLYPAHRWIYDKLRICESQGLVHGPHGITPSGFPVFSKPIYNLRGMGVGGKILRTREEYEREQTPGHLWMPLLTGTHVGSDVA